MAVIVGVPVTVGVAVMVGVTVSVAVAIGVPVSVGVAVCVAVGWKVPVAVVVGFPGFNQVGETPRFRLHPAKNALGSNTKRIKYPMFFFIFSSPEPRLNFKVPHQVLGLVKARNVP